MEGGAPQPARCQCPPLSKLQFRGAPSGGPPQMGSLQQGPPRQQRRLPAGMRVALPRVPLLCLLVLLLVWGPPCEGRLVALTASRKGPPGLTVSESLNTEGAPWAPPLEPVVGQLLYKGSSCVPSALAVSSLDFRPRLFRLSLFKGLCWLAQQLPGAAFPLLLHLVSGEGPPSPAAAAAAATGAAQTRSQGLAAAAGEAAAGAAAAAEVVTAGGAAVAAGAASKGDSWRWAFSRTLGSRRDALSSLLPFSFAFWGVSSLEGPPLSSMRYSLGGPFSQSEFGAPTRAQQTEQEQQELQQLQQEAEEQLLETKASGAAAAGGVKLPEEETADRPYAAVLGDSLWRAGLRRRPSPALSAPSRKRFWLFDRCSEEQLWGLIDAANGAGVAALLLTDTTFKDYSMPLLGNALAPKPRMPVVSVPSSPLLQQLKQHSAAAAAAPAVPPLYVLLDSEPPEAADCRVLQPLLFASVFGVLAWGAFAAAWSSHCRRDGGRDATPLHKLLLLPPTLKAAAAAAQAAYCMQCPHWSSGCMQYLVLVAMGLEMLAQVFFFSSLLFVSSGYLICRETLGRRESITLSMLVRIGHKASRASLSLSVVLSALRFLSPLVRLCLWLPFIPLCLRAFCPAHKPGVRGQQRQPGGAPGVVAAASRAVRLPPHRLFHLDLAVFASAVREETAQPKRLGPPELQSCSRNRHRPDSQATRLEYVRAAGGPPDLTAALELKLQMYRTHYLSCALFFVGEIGFCLLFFVALDRPDLAEVAQLILELSLWASVSATFKPRRRMPYFALLQAAEPQSILPLYAATPLLTAGEGGSLELMSSWGGGDAASTEAPIPWDRPILIVNPCASGDAAPPFRSLAVGTLVSPAPLKRQPSPSSNSSRRPSVEEPSQQAGPSSTNGERGGTGEASTPGSDPQAGQEAR
ncbi:hypothetical protein Efla_003855 [Eimeria flavescens]